MKSKKQGSIMACAMLVILMFFSGCNGTTKTTETTTTPSVQNSNSYSLQEISGHSSKEDCWLLINGKIYDATKFIPSHPGGEAILQGCGKDATTLFETRPMGSGTAHSQRAHDMLANYLIGELDRNA